MIEESSGVRRFLARLANAYRVKLERDEHKLYLEKLAVYSFTPGQWEELLDRIIDGDDKRYTFPELPIVLDFTNQMRREVAPPAPEFEIVVVDGKSVAKRKKPSL